MCPRLGWSKVYEFFSLFLISRVDLPLAACEVVQKNAKTQVMVQDSVVLGCLGCRRTLVSGRIVEGFCFALLKIGLLNNGVEVVRFFACTEGGRILGVLWMTQNFPRQKLVAAPKQPHD